MRLTPLRGLAGPLVRLEPPAAERAPNEDARISKIRAFYLTELVSAPNVVFNTGDDYFPNFAIF